MKKGTKMSEDAKRKMRESWCYDKHFTPDTRRKLSDSHKGKSLPIGTRQKISEATKGRKFSDAHKKHLSEGRMGDTNPFFNHTHTEEYKREMSEILTGRVFSEESIAKMSRAKEGMYNGEENPFFGKHHSEGTKDLLSTKRKELYASNPGLLKAILTFQSPNKKESQLLSILEPFGFKYVGDGQLIINGKCPDFWNGDHKLIELYGDYWHADDNPQERIDFFAEEGYNTIVLWEHELKDIEDVREQVINFVNANV